MQIKLRKVLAILACLAMLCTVLPMSALMSVSAAETPVLSMDFENGQTGFDSGSVVAEGPNGSNCLKWECSSAWAATTITISGIEQNADYTIAFKMKASGTQYVNLTIQDTKWYSNNYYGISVNPTTEWKDYSVDTNVGTYASTGSIYFKFQSSAAQTYWIDDIVITKKASAEPDPETPEGSTDNLVVNGDFEAGLANWSGSSGTKEIVTNDVHGGTQALKLTNPGQWGEAAVSKAFTVVPGQIYVIKWWSKRVSGTGTFNLYLIGDYDINSTTGQNWMADTSGNWVENTWTVKATNTSLQLKFSTEVTNPGVILIDDVTVYEKPAVTNGDFELGTTEGWAVYNGSTVTTDAAHTGSYGLHAKGNGWAGIAYQDIPVTNGRSYEFSFWYYINNTDGSGFNYKVSGQTSGTSYKAYWPNNAGEWTQVKFEFLATDESLIRLNFSGYNDTSTPDFYVDDVQLKEIKDPSYDGYIRNGDFETGNTTGWETWQNTTVSKTAAKSGQYGLEVHGDGGWGGLLKQSFNVQPNRDYILRFSVKAVSQGLNIKITDDATIAAGGDANAKLWGIYFNKTEWTDYEITFNSGVNTTASFQMVGSGIATNDDIVYLDNVSIEKVGGEGPNLNKVLTGGQTSIKDASSSSKGLAFRFQVNAPGAEILNTNAYVANSATVTPFKDDESSYELVKAGAVVTNNATVGKDEEAMTLDSVNGKKVINIEGVYLCEVNEDNFAFAVRILNIPDANVDTDIYARPYYVYADENGNEQVIYGNTKSQNYNNLANPKSSIKILSIGHSFSVDVMGTYLYDMLEQAGYEEITLGYLYYPGCSLSRHWEYISTNANGYERYGKNTNGSWVTTNNARAIDALLDEEWDYVTLQASPDYVGGENAEYSYIPGITDWIEENALNPNVEIKWHQIWAYSEGCDLWSYMYHDWDQMTMYNDIIAATEQYIAPDDSFTGIIPVGTAVQNARAKLGDIFNEPDVTMGGSDGYHLNNKYGDFLGSLTWACYFSGVDAHTITERSSGMTEAEFSAIADAVNAALDDWTQVTE